MGAWAILAFCIVAEVSATSLLTRSEGFGRPLYGLLALVILGGCFWALSQVLLEYPWVWRTRSGLEWHSANLHRWLVLLSATPHHHAGPVHRAGRCGCHWLEPINQSGLVRDWRWGICQKGMQHLPWRGEGNVSSWHECEI